METGLKVEVPEEFSKVIIKGVQWKPTGDIEKDTPDDFKEAEEGREMLESIGKVALLAITKEIPQGYSGELKFELRMVLG